MHIKLLLSCAIVTFNIRSEFMHITTDICSLLQLLSIRTVLRFD